MSRGSRTDPAARIIACYRRRNGNIAAVPERHRDTALVTESRLSRRTLAEMLEAPRRLPSSGRIPGAFGTCTAMSGSGARTAGILTTNVLSRTDLLGKVAIRLFACDAAVPGAIHIRFSALPAATGSAPLIATSMSAFESPERSDPLLPRAEGEPKLFAVDTQLARHHSRRSRIARRLRPGAGERAFDRLRAGLMRGVDNKGLAVRAQHHPFVVVARHVGLAAAFRADERAEPRRVLRGHAARGTEFRPRQRAGTMPVGGRDAMRRIARRGARCGREARAGERDAEHDEKPSLSVRAHGNWPEIREITLAEDTMNRATARVALPQALG